MIPLNAVLRSPRDPNAFSVFVLDGDGERAAARLRDVQLGEVVGNSVSVIDGLALNHATSPSVARFCATALRPS